MRDAESKLHFLGICVTVGVHVFILGTVIGLHVAEGQKKHTEEPFTTIEAGLAIKKKVTEGKQSKLPQKPQEPVVKPPEVHGIATDASAQPKPKEEKPKPPDEVAPDPRATFNKFRKVKPDDENQEGADDGSEFGTLERAQGDPYVGELIGRMTVNFTVPSVISDTGLETWGCVKLDADGKVVDWAIDPDHKSKSHAFNSAVEKRIHETTNMEKPVPDHLKKLLLGKFVCATFKY